MEQRVVGVDANFRTPLGRGGQSEDVLARELKVG
jgi:hypothetical protein